MLLSAASAQPDYVALAMVLVLLLAVAVMTVRKRFGKKTLPQPASPAEPAVAAPAPGSAGELKLHNVEPKTAAMLMAIVAEKSGKPLNELRFISIKEVTEK